MVTNLDGLTNWAKVVVPSLLVFVMSLSIIGSSAADVQAREQKEEGQKEEKQKEKRPEKEGKIKPGSELDRLQMQIKELRAAGRNEEADKLSREADELRARFKKSASKPELSEPGDELRRRIKELEHENAELRQMLERTRMTEKVQKEGARGDGFEKREVAEIHEKLMAVEKARAEAERAGRADEAEKLERAAAELKERYGHIQRSGGRGDEHAKREKLEQLHHQIERMHQAGRRDEAEELAHMARELARQIERGDDEHARHGEALESLKERARDLSAKSAELREAGRHEEAERAAHAAQDILERLEHERRGQRHASGAGRPIEPREELVHAINELREQMHRLRDEVNELRRVMRERSENR